MSCVLKSVQPDSKNSSLPIILFHLLYLRMLRPKLDLQRLLALSPSLGKSYVARGDPDGLLRIPALLQANERRKKALNSVEELNAMRNANRHVDKEELSRRKMESDEAEKSFFKLALVLPNDTCDKVPKVDVLVVKQSESRGLGEDFQANLGGLKKHVGNDNDRINGICANQSNASETVLKEDVSAVKQSEFRGLGEDFQADLGVKRKGKENNEYKGNVMDVFNKNGKDSGESLPKKDDFAMKQGSSRRLDGDFGDFQKNMGNVMGAINANGGKSESREGFRANLTMHADEQVGLSSNRVHPGNASNAPETLTSQPQNSIAPIKWLDHLEIAQANDLVDFTAGAKISGSKFVFLKREAALLEMTLQRMAVDYLVRHRGFVPISTPDLIKPSIVEACGFQPRGEENQIYFVKDQDLCLIGTSELALAGYLSNTKLKTEQRYAGISHCFRTEAGSKGKESKGLYRLHQFSKVEMFVACKPQVSEALHRELVDCSVNLCETLGLTWRVIDMPPHELGASAYRKFDVEVYMPGSKRWGEVASVTNCTDFQSRRLDIKMNNEYAHTLNGTACAVPRMLIAVLETYQQGDKSVRLPPALAAAAGFDEIRLNKSGKR